MASKASNSNGENAKKKSSYNLTLTSEQMDKLGQALSSRGWPSREVQYARHAFDAEVAVAKRAEEIRLRTGEDLAAVQAAEILLRDETRSDCDTFTEDHERLTRECAQQDDRILQLRAELLQSGYISSDVIMGVLTIYRHTSGIGLSSY